MRLFWLRLSVLGLVPVLGLVLGVVLMPGLARAQESLSGSLSEPIGGSVYSENDQNGFSSSSLITGSRNLTSSYVRSGTSDPLSFLIESSGMSPYTGLGSLSSTADASVFTETLDNPLIAQRLNEYRNNSAMMAGAGASSVAVGRPARVGSGVSAVAARNPFSVASAGFGSSLRPSAAGSTAGALGANSANVGNQSAALAGSSLSGGLGVDGSGLSGADLAGSDALSGSGALSGSSGSSTYDQLAGASEISTGMGSLDGGSGSGSLASISSSLDGGSGSAAGGSGSLAAGSYGAPAPGQVFPDLGVSTASSTGFSDSTKGTAGQQDHPEGWNLSPLLSGRMNAVLPPFAELGSESSSFLRPSLTQAPYAGVTAPTQTIAELVRKARQKELISNSGSALPSPFTQRAMVRAYQKEQRNPQRRPSRYSTAPSVTVPTSSTQTDSQP